MCLRKHTHNLQHHDEQQQTPPKAHRENKIRFEPLIYELPTVPGAAQGAYLRTCTAQLLVPPCALQWDFGGSHRPLLPLSLPLYLHHHHHINLLPVLQCSGSTPWHRQQLNNIQLFTAPALMARTQSVVCLSLCGLFATPGLWLVATLTRHSTRRTPTTEGRFLSKSSR